MLHEIAIFLAAAVIAVPLSQRLGLGAVLGYLSAGIVIGPWGFRFITDVESILNFSEFGVVLLLFLIGLELQPSRLWRLRAQVLGLGGAQVLITTLLLAGIALALGLPTPAAVVAGFGLAMSSTAFSLQMLGERQELGTRHGAAAFAVLLFQDLAIIPFLVLVPLLAATGVDGAANGFSMIAAGKALGVIALVIVAGRYLLRPLLRLLAAAKVAEMFTAAGLLLVIGTALLMEAAGLSASLGAFLAGVLLADSEYRHELQASIEPLKGLLLGLFFIAVGMSVNLGLLGEKPVILLGLVFGLIALKAAVLYAIGRAARLSPEAARSFAAALPQGGEFAFVLFGLAASVGLIGHPVEQLLVLAVTLSMMATPPLYALQARFRATLTGPAYDTMDASAAPVILAGFGPFGQIIGRILRVKKIGFTVLEKNHEQVDFVRRFGNKIYYGDAARLELLKAAHADQARIFVISIANPAASLQIAETVRRHFPHLRIFAVANDRNHALRLMDLGIKHVIRRAYFSSLEMTRQLLTAMGDSDDDAQMAIATFRRHDETTLLKQQAVYREEQQFIQTTQAAARELEQLFASDKPNP